MKKLYVCFLASLFLIAFTQNNILAQCDSEAGTMELNPIITCQGNSVTAVHQGNQVLDGDDIMQFVLHDNPDAALGNIFATNTAPVFIFEPGMVFGTSYYISAIVGNDDGTGNVDLTDICLSVSVGNEIVYGEAISITCQTLQIPCNGEGTFDCTIVGGLEPLSYLWTGPNGFTSTDANPSTPEAGLYTVEVTSAGECYNIFTVEAIQDAELEITSSVVEVSCFGQSDGIIIAQPNGGTPPFDYLWSTGDTAGPTLGNVSAGTYTVTITDSEGCSAIDFFVINEPSELFMTTSFTQPDCQNGQVGTITVTVTGGTAPYVYQWSNGANTPTIIGLTFGTYSITITDANGCTVVDNIEIIDQGGGVDCGVIQGKVIIDENENCVIDIDEDPLSGWIVQAIGAETFYGVTDEDGNYVIHALPDDYLVSVLLPGSGYWGSCNGIVPITLEDADDVKESDYPLQKEVNCADLEVDMSVSFLRRCFNQTYHVNYCNNGTEVAENAHIEVVFDDLLTVNFASQAYDDLGNNTFSFNIGDVEIGDCGFFTINVHLSCDAVLGMTICTEANIFPNEPCAPTDPNWSGASVALNAVCNGDQIEFQIQNIGDNNMLQPANYIVVEDGVMLMTGSEEFQLNSMESLSLNFPANGSTYILEADQVAFHPGNSMPLLAVEGCGTNGGGTFSTGWVTQFPENDADNFVTIDCQEVIGSYDPNDKRGFPKGYGEEHYIEPGQELEYHIRFQNTGTDTAFTVRIEDVISPSLDIASLRPGASSHSYSMEIIGGDTLSFLFENILLPDSNVNEVASHGFVKFRIAQRAGLELGTVIENEAAIFFDFNEAVITNQTFHELGEHFVITSIRDPHLPEARVFVYPNPFSKAIYITFDNLSFDIATFELYDLVGRPIGRETFTKDNWTYRNDDLKPGMYVYQVKVDDKLVSTGKLVAK